MYIFKVEDNPCCKRGGETAVIGLLAKLSRHVIFDYF